MSWKPRKWSLLEAGRIVVKGWGRFNVNAGKEDGWGGGRKENVRYLGFKSDVRVHIAHRSVLVKRVGGGI